MTTYLLLALTDDGRVTAYEPDDLFRIERRQVDPIRTGTDRNAYSTYEIAGYSIDVVRLPQASAATGLCDAVHPVWPMVTCAMPSDHVLRGQAHVGGGYAWGGEGRW